MITKISMSAMAVLLGAGIASAQSDFNQGIFTMPADHTYVAVPKPMPNLQVAPAVLPAKLPAEWTIMVFVNGKNNLEPFALRDINEMEQVGSNAKLNIVVEMGRMDGYDTTDGDWKGVRRYLVKKDKDTAKIGSPVVQDLGMIDMGDYNNLIAFGKWAKAAYPAKHYMLIVWNHGSGWTKSGERMITKGISYDEQSGHHINTVQLGQSLAAMGKVDIYGSDACLMQMAEVDYEIKDYTDFIVGSEETEPGDGYTYNTFLAPLAANPSMTAAQVAKQAVNAYSDHYEAVDTGYTQSYVKSSAIPELLTKINEFAYAITQAGEKDLARSARDKATKFAVEENKDLHHFASLVVAGTKSADVKAKGQALMTFITSTLVQQHRYKSDPGSAWSDPVDFSASKGISIYIPSGPTGDGYTEMAWAKYSNWDEFLTWLNK